MSNIEKIDTNLEDCKEINVKVYGDKRGRYLSLTDEEYKEIGLNGVQQFSESLSRKGTLRGMHFQKDPYCQAKLVGCVNGRVLDVVVDCRKDSKTFGQYKAVVLDSDKRNMLFVPKGFAHGFLALEDNCLFQYAVDNEYNPKLEDGIAFDDPKVNIPWDDYLAQYGIDQLIMSEKDQARHGIDEMTNEFSIKPKRFLVTGYNGQLGFDIVRELHKRGEYEILAVDINEMDITSRDQVFSIINEYKPDVIFHCAAWTAVDKAEDDKRPNTINKEALVKIISEASNLSLEESAKVFDSIIDGLKTNTNPDGTIGIEGIGTFSNKYEQKLSPKEMCYKVNVEGTKNITDAAMEIGAKVVYMSTDYVFDGTKEDIYDENDIPAPKSVYGETKYLGEEEIRRNPNHFITRISWVFGINGKNFIRTMLNASTKRDSVTVVNDQIGSPTYTVDLAKLLVDMSFTDKYGTYDVTNEGYCSWCDFTKKIYEKADAATTVIPVTTEDYLKISNAKQAYRPANSRLDKSKLEENGFKRLPSYEDAVERFIDELKKSTRLQDKRLGLTKK